MNKHPIKFPFPEALPPTPDRPGFGATSPAIPSHPPVSPEDQDAITKIFDEIISPPAEAIANLDPNVCEHKEFLAYVDAHPLLSNDETKVGTLTVTCRHCRRVAAVSADGIFRAMIAFKFKWIDVDEG